MTPSLEDEARELFAALREGTILPAQAERLQTLLRDSDEALRLYVQYVALQAHLLERGAGMAMSAEKGGSETQNFKLGFEPELVVCEVDSEAENAQAYTPSEAMALSPDGTGDGIAANVPSEQTPLTSTPPWETSRKLAAKSRRRMWPGVAATLFVGLTVAAVVLTRPGKAPPATLGATIGAEWETPNGSLATGAALPGSLLELKAGLAEVRFSSGALMIVQGPARFRILDANAANLSLGKLTATVPPAAHGFAIQTSVSRIVDLGTEFGVEMRDDHSMRAEVFRGRVEMHAIAASPNAAPTILVANHAVEISSGSLASVPAAPHPERFVRAITKAPPQQQEDEPNYERWLAFSRELRHDPSLVSYYTFEKPEGNQNRLPNCAEDTLGQYDGTIENATWCDGRLPGKHGLAFNGKDSRVKVNISPQFQQLTIALWVRVDTWACRTAGLLMSDDWNKAGQVHFELVDGLLQSGVFTDITESVHGDNFFQRNSKPITLGQWRFLATTFDATTAEVSQYCDGVSLCSDKRAPGVPMSIGSAEIGNWNAGNWRTEAPRALHGRIDELAVFNRVLSPLELQTFYLAGRVPPRSGADRGQ